MKNQEKIDDVSCEQKKLEGIDKQPQNLHNEMHIKQSSQNSLKYHSYFKAIFEDQLPLEQIYMILNENQIKRLANFVSKIKVEIIDKYKDSMRLQLKWGYFKMQVNVLKIFMDFQHFNRRLQFRQGAFGKIYLLSRNNRRYVMKSIGCLNNLQIVYKQYFIAKICSSLKIGPILFSLFGYDIILFNDKDGQFVMEECQDFNFKEQRNNINNTQIQISKSIHLLHTLHICHCDIKLQNIMFSKISNKYVLIDFGLSRFVKENIGQKTLTLFVGTYRNSSPQMKKLYFLKVSNYIDLYYNDLFGLLSSVNKITTKIEIIEDFMYQQQQIQQQNPITSFIDLFNAKYQIFDKNYKKAIQFILRDNELKNSSKKIFLQQILPLKIGQIEHQIKNAKEQFQHKQNESHNKLDQQFLFYLKHFYQNIQAIEFNIGQLFEIKSFQVRQNDKFENYSQILLQNLFSTIADLFTFQFKTQLNNVQTLRRMNLIQKMFVFSNSSLLNQQKLQFEPSLLYKTQKVLRIFMQKFIQQNNLVCLERIRVIFVQLQNYQSAYQIQQFLLNKFGQNSNFFILRCKFFCGRKFWRNNICYHICEGWIKQVQQKEIQKSLQNYDLLQNLKKFCLNLISATMSQESKQKWKNSLKTIKQLKLNPSLLEQRKQDLSQIAEKIQMIIDLLNRFSISEIPYEFYIIKLVRIMHESNQKSKPIDHFFKFGKTKYISTIFYTTDSYNVTKIYKQYLSLFQKGSKIYIYQIKYLLVQFFINNKVLNCLLLNQFVQYINKNQVHTFVQAISNLHTLSSFFSKLFQANSNYYRHMCPKLTQNLNLFYQNILTYCKQNKCLQKMDPSHLIFTQFYIDIINEGLEKSIDKLLLYFQTNLSSIQIESSTIITQIIDFLNVIQAQSTYKKLQLNQLKSKINIKDEVSVNLRIWAYENFLIQRNEISNSVEILSKSFYTFYSLILNLKIPQTAQQATTTRFAENIIHKSSLNFTKIMPLQEVRIVLENCFKNNSLKFMADNYLLSILTFVLFYDYVFNCNKAKQKLKTMKIDLQQKSWIALDQQKQKRLLILCLVGIQKIYNFGLKNHLILQIEKMKVFKRAKGNKLMNLRKYIKRGHSSLIYAYGQTIKRNINKINDKFAQIKKKLNCKIIYLQRNFELS